MNEADSKYLAEKMGLMTILSDEGIINRNRMVRCRCDCGNEKVVRLQHLKNGKIKSCGCYNRKIAGLIHLKHGDTIRGEKTSKEYRAWTNMITRCTNENNRSYKNYGGRGICVCKEWKDDYRNFLRDMGRCPVPKYTIDRINNDGNYEPGNCKWSTFKEQNSNYRRNIFLNIDGKKLTLKQASEIAGIKYSTLWNRFKFRPRFAEELVGFLKSRE